MIRETKNPDEFLHGVWVAIEFLVLSADEPTHAQEIAQSCGIDRETAYRLSKLTGYRTREMRRWSRENLDVSPDKGEGL